MTDEHPVEAAMIDEKKPDDWTRGAVYALSLACRLGSYDVAKEGPVAGDDLPGWPPSSPGYTDDDLPPEAGS